MIPENMDSEVQMRLDAALDDSFDDRPVEPRLYPNDLSTQREREDIIPIQPVLDEEEVARRARRNARFGQVNNESDKNEQNLSNDTATSATAIEDNSPPEDPVITDPKLVRTEAIFLTTKSLEKLDTKKVMRFINSLLPQELRASFKGVEWIDDIRLCLRFASPESASHAFVCLLEQELAASDLDQLRSLVNRAVTESTEESHVENNNNNINIGDDEELRREGDEESTTAPPTTTGGTQDPSYLVQLVQHRRAHPFSAQLMMNSWDSLLPTVYPTFVRFALQDDIKGRNAALKSQYYAEQSRLIKPLPGSSWNKLSPQEAARKRQLLASTELGSRMGGRVRTRDDRMREDLDAELDNLQNTNNSMTIEDDDLDQEEAARNARKEELSTKFSANTRSVWDSPLAPTEKGDFGNEDPQPQEQEQEQEQEHDYGQDAEQEEPQQGQEEDLFSRIQQPTLFSRMNESNLKRSK